MSRECDYNFIVRSCNSPRPRRRSHRSLPFLRVRFLFSSGASRTREKARNAYLSAARNQISSKTRFILSVKFFYFFFAFFISSFSLYALQLLLPSTVILDLSLSLALFLPATHLFS